VATQAKTRNGQQRGRVLDDAQAADGARNSRQRRLGRATFAHGADGAYIFTPPMLGRRWHCSPEVIINLIKLGRLAGFSLNPNCKRPRWRVCLRAIEEYEMSRATTTPKASRRSAKSADVIPFF
jgi:hypothetical protein